jgi:hypothetical protein
VGGKYSNISQWNIVQECGLDSVASGYGPVVECVNTVVTFIFCKRWELSWLNSSFTWRAALHGVTRKLVNHASQKCVTYFCGKICYLLNSVFCPPLLQVSDDKKKIRRSPDSPLPVMNEERRQELMSRTVYCKGFPRDDTTLDNLLEFFSSYGLIENIQVMTSTILNFIYSWMSYGLSLCVKFQEMEIILFL